MAFFASLCTTYDYQAVLLAHHANDQAETVLKRVFEGVALPYLCGVRPETEIFGVKFMAPLLSISSKEQIFRWLESHGLKGFQDETNTDPRFLRGGFAQAFFLSLRKSLANKSMRSLCRIGTEAGELRNYLNERVHPYFSQMVKGKMGSFLDS